jgi:hypothetical protein
MVRCLLRFLADVVEFVVEMEGLERQLDLAQW